MPWCPAYPSNLYDSDSDDSMPPLEDDDVDDGLFIDAEQDDEDNYMGFPIESDAAYFAHQEYLSAA